LVTGKPSKIRVFLAEDHPIVRRGVSLIVDAEPDMEVVGEAADGWEAVEGVLRLNPDVVVMGLDLPKLSGIEATRRITEASSRASVLVLSGLVREDLLFEALEAGAAGYALRGIAVEDFLRAIRTVHAGEVCISPRMATKLVGGFLKRIRNGASEDGFERLSLREREVLPLLAAGRSQLEIASTLRVSPYTVQTYRQRIMKKLDLHSKTDVLRYALRRGIVSLEQ